MRLLIEIAAAALLIVCITVSSAAFAGQAADGVTCSFSAPKGASPAVELAAKMIVKKHGQDRLGSVAKLHFKTTQAVLAGLT